MQMFWCLYDSIAYKMTAYTQGHRVDSDTTLTRNQSESEPFSDLVRVKPPRPKPLDKDKLDKELSR